MRRRLVVMSEDRKQFEAWMCAAGLPAFAEHVYYSAHMNPNKLRGLSENDTAFVWLTAWPEKGTDLARIVELYEGLGAKQFDGALAEQIEAAKDWLNPYAKYRARIDERTKVLQGLTYADARPGNDSRHEFGVKVDATDLKELLDAHADNVRMHGHAQRLWLALNQIDYPTTGGDVFDRLYDALKNLGDRMKRDRETR